MIEENQIQDLHNTFDIEGFEVNEKTGEIIVLDELVIELKYTSVVRARRCEYPSSGAVLVQVDITNPDHSSNTLITINDEELYGGTNCLGDHSKSKKVSALSSGYGKYIINLSGIAAYRRTLNGYASVYPSIRVVADGATVVDVSYPPPAQNNTVRVTGEWAFIYRKPKT
ncbi:MAG: hypothetical protein KZQ80_15395 [Candidatus Thiodiazotropha sp. (ex Monitilora ramsayi)]|nr:hypothetical protein [Candidatus Thiodiazotropha sp. (ex Monitilora ramsayi)]